MISAPLAPLWHAASVRRWHQNPALAHTHQTIADHQGRCVLLLLALHPAPSLALLRAVATHDIGERVAGDLSADFKRAAPVIAARHAEVEADARAALFAPDWPLTEDEAAWAKLVDQLDAHCWCLAFAPSEYCKERSGWLFSEEALFLRADRLQVGGKVRQLLEQMYSREW